MRTLLFLLYITSHPRVAPHPREVFNPRIVPPAPSIALHLDSWPWTPKTRRRPGQ